MAIFTKKWFIKPSGGRQYYILNKSGQRDSAELVQCFNCGISFLKRSSEIRKTETHFCSHRCHGIALRLSFLDGKNFLGESGTRSNMHKIARQFLSKKQCLCCKFDKYSSLIELHHRDGDYTNNTKSNLVWLCIRCHDYITYGFADLNADILVFRHNSPTFSENSGIASRRAAIRFHPQIVCAGCAFSTFTPLIEAHHIDKNRRNNTANNLLWLCDMCHAAVHKGLAHVVDRELRWFSETKHAAVVL